MKAVVFSRGKAPGRAPAGVETRPLDELKTALGEIPTDTLVYLDVSGLAEGERTRLVVSTIRKAGRRVGILDPAGRVKDVAALFHAGAVDYVGKATGLRGLSTKRLNAVRFFAGADGLATSPVRGHDLAPEAPAGSARGAAATVEGAETWETVQDGREHKFAFLFIEVDDTDDLKKKYQTTNIATAMGTFQGFIERIVLPYGGRLWMWSRFGGLVLFPLGGRDCPAVVCGLRILLGRIFFDAEESPLPGRLSFRMALSVGSTIYRPGDTDKIVSEGLNAIFHLGRRFVRPGQFLLTAEAAALTPEPLRPWLVPAGSYEGHKIVRLLQPVSLSGRRG